MAVFYSEGVPMRERYEKERRILWSGKRIGQDYLLMTSQNGARKIWADSGKWEWVPDAFRAPSREAAQIIAEKPIRWGYGIGHMDAFLPETASAIEILSSATASNEMVHSKLLQLVLYMLHDEEAENGALVIVNPRDYDEERVVVMRDSEQWHALVEQATDRLAQLDKWKETGELPPRVCRHRHDSPAYWCRAADFCFSDFVAPPAGQQLDEQTTRAVTELALRWEEIKAREKALGANLKELENERAGVQEQLAQLVNPGLTSAGGFEIKRSVRSRNTFKLPLAEKDSRFPSELLAEFSRQSTYEVWSISRSGVEEEVDYGEVPF